MNRMSIVLAYYLLIALLCITVVASQSDCEGVQSPPPK